MKTATIEDKLSWNKFDVDKDVHIRLNENACRDCREFACLYACPAGCFKKVEEHITFSYEGCLECGSCRLVCEQDAIVWTLPRGGFGICYQYG